MSRATTELLQPTSSHSVSPVTVTPFPGGALARVSTGSPAPEPFEVLLDRQERGTWEALIRGGKPGWVATLLATQSEGQTQSRTFVSGASRIAPQPVSASPGSQLRLDLSFAWISSAPELPLSWQVHLWRHLQGPNVSQAHKVHWFINHGTVNLLPPLLQQGFLYLCQPSLSPASLRLPFGYRFTPLPKSQRALALVP